MCVFVQWAIVCIALRMGVAKKMLRSVKERERETCWIRGRENMCLWPTIGKKVYVS